MAAFVVFRCQDAGLLEAALIEALQSDPHSMGVTLRAKRKRKGNAGPWREMWSVRDA